jgi:hypothetical protein
LTTSQIAALSTSSTAVLKTTQIQALGTSSVAALTTEQVASLSTSAVAALSTSQAKALTTEQVVALTSAQVQALTTAAIGALTTSQTAAMETSDLAVLKTTQIAVLGTSNVATLTTEQVVALTTAQIQALTTAAIGSLTTEQVAALETVDVVALMTTQIMALSTGSMAALTTTAIDAITTSQVCTMSAAQIQALSTTQFSHLAIGTPVILDLNGDGVKTLSISSGVKFDLFADGNKVQTGWVSSSDGLLVLDRNSDGVINDGSELFGSSTVLASGQRANDGYQALRELDANNDGYLSQDDTAFANLKVWVDANSDGTSDIGETKFLADLQISKINLQTVNGTEMDNGNLVGLTSTYETTDGTSHAAADVWFVADKSSTDAAPLTKGDSDVDQAIAALVAVDSVSTKNVEPLASDIASDVVGQSTPSSNSSPQNLRSRVSSLAQAIGSFDEDVVQNEPGSILPVDNAAASAASRSAIHSMVAISNMVDVLKQFDVNGNPLAQGTGVALASTTKAISLHGQQDPLGGGFLASSI